MKMFSGLNPIEKFKRGIDKQNQETHAEKQDEEKMPFGMTKEEIIKIRDEIEAKEKSPF